MQEGYIYWHQNKVVTIWSAPNYMYISGNDAAIMRVDEKLEATFKVFKEQKGNFFADVNPK